MHGTAGNKARDSDYVHSFLSRAGSRSCRPSATSDRLGICHVLQRVSFPHLNPKAQQVLRLSQLQVYFP